MPISMRSQKSQPDLPRQSSPTTKNLGECSAEVRKGRDLAVWAAGRSGWPGLRDRESRKGRDLATVAPDL